MNTEALIPNDDEHRVLLQIPFIFKPTILRSDYKFRICRLTSLMFAIMWLCEEINKKHGLVSIKATCKQYNIHTDGIRRWLSI